MSFDLHDLGIAYRKAKVDLYYSSHASLTAIADYEEQLSQNLADLLARLNSDNEDWIQKPDFLGGWNLVPKGIDLPKPEGDDSALIFASPAEKWAHACESGNDEKSGNKPKAEFRLMAQCSLDFHVLSALWMLKVGHQYDNHLTDSAYGNRLRRGQKGDINPLSLGSFKPYLKPFRDWRDNGIQAMRSALAAGKRVVALTADVSSFYHELNPGFMLDAAFNALFDLNLSDEEQKLNRLFIQALAAWAANTPLKKGLPVGLPASAIVANMALFELDRRIEKHVAPLYYGRYVDDIILVMENGKDFRSTASVWQWLFERSGGMLDWSDSEKKQFIQFIPAYLGDSRIQFTNAKNKVFLLSGEQGSRLVESIAFQVYQRASEWRALPNLPLDPGRVGTDLVAATQNDGEAADNLRKADALTMRRAGFAIKLRDFEAYERDLPPEVWLKHRHAFFLAFMQHVLVLPQYFELALYVPRVLRLATACEDFEYLRRMLDELECLCDAVEGHCETGIKSCEDDQHPGHDAIIKYWRKQLFASAQESIMAAMPARLTKGGKADWKRHMEGYWPKHIEVALDWQLSLAGFQLQHQRLFAFDLAHMPFRFIALPKEMVAQRGLEPKKSATSFDEAHAVLPNSVTGGIRTLADWAKLKGMPHGLLFATRPFNLTELYILVKDPYAADVAKPLQSVVLAIRGFSPEGAMPHWDKHKTLQVPYGEAQAQYGIVVSSWKTELQSWVASVMRKTDPDTDRYTRLNRLLTNVISQPNGANYLVLPELSLPVEWFMRLALHLKRRGISLITGVEYLHAPRKRVRNQVWAALLHDGLGFPSQMIYRQDKQRPAYHEELEIKHLADLEMRPEKAWKTPPIIQHGDFRFAMLVCSELTNIQYRAALRGQIDALFVPEWNPDTTSFNSLVESAAMDIHAYIIQCNDREYGDSRIRAPYKDQWKRDMLRVKGGIYDYCVTGRIDVQSLRQFQSSHRSPDKPFKPVPDGFEMNVGREVLPVGE